MIRIALVALCGLTSPALAQACAPYSAVSKGLASKFGEEAQFSMLDRDGVALEFFGNASSGTWTIIAIGRGTACLIASGQEWRPGRVAQEEPL